eukprot:TRINITY_DN7606_c0_g1_i7.p1 TRINITY_DN7606_c0_g1~~TRINITY_DN7606_c0_g1_i7.p1  ORF type:complete len:130 (+),score=48.14 TRINITY_DN7606_c0_g1_i7:62-451(+)
MCIRDRFRTHAFAEIKSKNEKMDMKEVMKMIAEQWKGLKEPEKEKWNADLKKAKEKYDAELKDYEARFGPVVKRKSRDSSNKSSEEEGSAGGRKRPKKGASDKGEGKSHSAEAEGKQARSATTEGKRGK